MPLSSPDQRAPQTSPYADLVAKVSGRQRTGSSGKANAFDLKTRRPMYNAGSLSVISAQSAYPRAEQLSTLLARIWSLAPVRCWGWVFRGSVGNRAVAANMIGAVLQGQECNIRFRYDQTRPSNSLNLSNKRRVSIAFLSRRRRIRAARVSRTRRVLGALMARPRRAGVAPVSRRCRVAGANLSRTGRYRLFQLRFGSTSSTCPLPAGGE